MNRFAVGLDLKGFSQPKGFVQAGSVISASALTTPNRSVCAPHLMSGLGSFASIPHIQPVVTNGKLCS